MYLLKRGKGRQCHEMVSLLTVFSIDSFKYVSTIEGVLYIKEAPFPKE